MLFSTSGMSQKPFISENILPEDIELHCLFLEIRKDKK